MMPARPIVERASIEDAEEILELQRLAFVSEAEIIDDFTIPPLHQTMGEIVAEFHQQGFLKVVLGGRVIGSVRAYSDQDTCYIGKLIVHPDHQNQGIGTALLRAAEEQFQTVERYELFAGQKSRKKLHVCEKAGYRVFESRAVSEKLTLVYLEKTSAMAQQPPGSQTGSPRLPLSHR